MSNACKTTLKDNEQGQRMAEVLEKLAALNPLQGIADPVAWEREIRQERPLPGRDESNGRIPRE